MTSCVGNTKASSEYIVFKGASIYQTDLYISTPGNNINNINSDKLLIKLLFHHLEHLDFMKDMPTDWIAGWVVQIIWRNTGLSKKMDGIWNRYNLKSTGRIYTFGVLKCSEKFKVLDLP